MKRVFGAGLLALSGLLTTAVGVAHADEVQVDGGYATLTACQADGPHVEITTNDSKYSHWDCRQDGDGLWYVWLSN